MGILGPTHLLFLAIVAILLFGPARLPEIGRTIGKSVKDFKDAIEGTGIKDALDGVSELRSSVSPANVARTFVPGVADTQDTLAAAKDAVAPATPAESKRADAADAADVVDPVASQPPR
jgi:sec-independent protein translocase protein TatA